MKEILESVLPKAGQKFIPYLISGMEKAEINTPARISHFISQVAHESGNFVYVKEIWGPTPTQTRYEGRKDLGNTQAGDGKRFAGRGLIQVTGRFNYSALSTYLFGDNRLLQNPELLEQPEYAVMSAIWFWSKNNLNKIADAGTDKATCEKVTRRINGGINGLEDRWKKFQAILQKLN